MTCIVALVDLPRALDELHVHYVIDEPGRLLVDNVDVDVRGDLPTNVRNQTSSTSSSKDNEKQLVYRQVLYCPGNKLGFKYGCKADHSSSDWPHCRARLIVDVFFDARQNIATAKLTETDQHGVSFINISSISRTYYQDRLFIQEEQILSSQSCCRADKDVVAASQQTTHHRRRHSKSNDIVLRKEDQEQQAQNRQNVLLTTTTNTRLIDQSTNDDNITTILKKRLRQLEMENMQLRQQLFQQNNIVELDEALLSLPTTQEELDRIQLTEGQYLVKYPQRRTTPSRKRFKG